MQPSSPYLPCRAMKAKSIRPFRFGLRLETLRDVLRRVLGDELPGQDPQAAAGLHEDGDRLDVFPVHVVVDVSTAVEGDLLLGGHPAKDDADS
jgi:hypothetical protein